MTGKRTMILGEKESFLTRVLVNKLKDAGIECHFSKWDVDAIHSYWEDTGIVTLFMDNGRRPSEDALHFLVDRMGEDGTQVIPIGEKTDIAFIFANVPGDLIYKSFTRPVNNDEYVKVVTDYFKKVEAGEYRKCILVVDDDPNYLGLVREWLKEKYRVSMVNSGLQAIKWLGKNKADLILLDHEMPVTTGPQVLEMLRSDPETKGIPVMFLTGKSDKQSVMKVVALKPEGYFLKSIKREELLQKLDEFFFSRR